MGDVSVMWFRRDLRLNDHPALLAAAGDGRRVLPLFVLDPALLARSGQPRVQFLHRCLKALSESLDGRLLVLRGDPASLVPAVARHFGASEVHVSEDFAPYGRRRDDRVEAALGSVPLIRTGSPYAVSPGRVVKSDGASFAVYTPYLRAWKEHGHRGPARPGSNVAWIDVPTRDVPHQV